MMSFVLDLSSLPGIETAACIEKRKQGQCDSTIGPFFLWDRNFRPRLGRALLGYNVCIICADYIFCMNMDVWMDGLTHGYRIRRCIVTVDR